MQTQGVVYIAKRLAEYGKKKITWMSAWVSLVKFSLIQSNSDKNFPRATITEAGFVSH